MKKVVTLFFAGTIVIGCWAFPSIWYEKPTSGQEIGWLTIQTNVPGWSIEFQQVGNSAERVLAADELKYAECVSVGDGAVVRLFTAKRFTENPYEIGLFVHTPDRCWTEAGWVLAEFEGDHRQVNLNGIQIEVERRVFRFHDTRELVYFFGLVGGRALPYRLDHNLSVGRKYRLSESVTQSGGVLRATDRLLWSRVWDSFASRKQLFGAKEFVRLSTEVKGSLDRADELLERGMTELLSP